MLAALRAFASVPVALVLCLAALLKLLSLPLVHNPETTRELLPLTQMAFVMAEMTLAFWLVSGWREASARRVGIAVFSIFACMAISKVATGLNDCGCFGNVQVHPLTSLAIDVTCLAFLFLWAPRGHASPPHRRADFALVRTCGCVAMGAVMLTASLRATADGFQRISPKSPESTILEPASWVGQELPIAKFIYDGHELMEGNWLVLFYRDSCVKCHELLHLVQQGQFAPPAGYQLAFVKIPPTNPRQALRPFGAWLWTSLDSQQDWLIETPCVLTVVGGEVRSWGQTW